MARPSKEQRLKDKFEDFKADFDHVQSVERPERMQCLQDRRFVAIPGAQYEGAVGEALENSVRFEANRCNLAVQRVENEYRNNRVTVTFVAKDGRPTDLADACAGLYRADEQASNAVEAYDNAFREGIAGGIGAWRLRARYEDDDDEDDDAQRIIFEPIFDADSTVFFSADAKRADKSDAKRCWVLTPHDRKTYELEHEDNPDGWEKSVTQSQFDWVTADVVWLAETYEVEEDYQTVRYYRNELVEDADERKVTEADLEANPELETELEASGWVLSRERKIGRNRVHKYIMSGGKIIEDCGYIAGEHIPVIPYYGRHEVIDGIERITGIIRHAKDMQRLTNMLLSWLGDLAAKPSDEKPYFTPEQVAGFEHLYERDRVDRYAYFLLNPVKDASGQKVPMGPLAYSKPPSIPPAMAALMQISSEMLTDLLGNAQAGEQVEQAVSGKAIELIQNRLDMQTFIYLSNFATYAMKRSGQVWLSMMRDIALQPNRTMKTVDASGVAGTVTINQPLQGPDGKEIVALDFSRAKLDVAVDVGPSSASKRAATVRALTGVAGVTDDPSTKQALTFAILENLEGEGLQGVKDWARKKGLTLGIVKPTKDEKKELAVAQQNQQPDPQSAFLLAEAGKAQAQTGLVAAQTEKAKAETAATLAEIDTAAQDSAIRAAQALMQATQPAGA